MQKDEIRERLITLLKHLEYQYTQTHSIMTENVADYLLQNGVTVQEWIPAAEQLPTEADEDVSECVLAIERQDGFARRWTGRSVRNCPELFTYWMPLPQAPKEDDDD